MLHPRMLETEPSTEPSGQAPAPEGPRGRPGLKILVGVLVVVLALAAVGVGYYRWCQGASGPQEDIRVEIPEGTSGDRVISLLHERGVIRCDLVARFIVRRRGLSDSFVAGTYDLQSNMTLDQALEALAAGPLGPETVEITIPEGWRLTQIAERVADELGVPKGRFLKLAQSGRYALPPYLPRGTETVEGFLFPKTYEFVEEEVSADGVIRRLVEQFGKEVEGLPWRRARELGVTPYEVVVIASMIEREARVPEERPLVAAVVYNRLARGMTLGIDATIQYVDPDPSNGLTESDLAIDSPYNTRLHSGLPPTPIASPGLESIRAALFPADVDYLYYVLCEQDGPGRHRFSASEGEFLANRAECLE